MEDKLTKKFKLLFYTFSLMTIAGIIGLSSYWCNAQDIQFSQFYANSLYINPAFAGSVHELRGTLHQRLQWPSLDAKFVTTSISIDGFSKKYNSGIGLLAIKDWQGSNPITSQEVQLLYSYQLPLTSKWSLRAGLQAGYVTKHIDYSILTFPDQFDSKGFKNINSEEPFGANRRSYFDFSSGGLLYSDNFFVGISLHNINRPFQSFYNYSNPLARKFAITTGYKIDLSRQTNSTLGHVKEISLTPTAHYKFQGKSDQLDLGIYFLYTKLIAGAWYRGLPIIKRYRPGLQNNESVVILLGYRIHNLSFTYSYDFTISKLVALKNGGSHELNITYIHHWPQHKKYLKKLPCPDL